MSTDRHHRLEIKINIQVVKEAEGSFVATCPQLGCIFVHDETEEAALVHVQDAIRSYLETSLKHGDPIPEEVVVSHTEIGGSEEVNRRAQIMPVPELVADLDVTRSYDLAVPT